VTKGGCTDEKQSYVRLLVKLTTAVRPYEALLPSSWNWWYASFGLCLRTPGCRAQLFTLQGGPRYGTRLAVYQLRKLVAVFNNGVVPEGPREKRLHGIDGLVV